MDPRRLLTDEWNTVERLIATTCRKRGLTDADGDVFASMVKIRLFENDCAIVRNFRNESKFSTYLNIIVQRIFSDFCVKRLGKWHPSAAASRLGPLALELERMIHREGYAPEEAITSLQTANPGVDRSALNDLLADLPSRQRRHSTISIEAIVDDLSGPAEADVLVVDDERRRMTDRVASVVRGFLERLDDTDRLMLQFHFEADMQLSQIARILGVQQKPLYRRREHLLRDLRKELTLAKITEFEVADLIGQIPEDCDFGLRKAELRPTESEEGVTAHPEVPR
jgi:RNA polymerase sigma factor (sigma-70 family)